MTTFFIILLSVSFASFGNNIISYFTNSRKLELKRSLCLCGNVQLNIAELIPVLSFILIKGRCKKCNLKLPYRFLFVEILFTFIGLTTYLVFGLSVKFLLLFLFFFILLLIGFVDYLSFTIPDSLVLLIAILSVTYSLIFSKDLLLNLSLSLILPLSFLILNIFFEKIKGIPAIGIGDIKLLIFMPFIFTFPLVLIGLWLSALIGLLGYSFNKNKWPLKIPFGFFLWIGFTVTELFGTQFLTFYSGFIS